MAPHPFRMILGIVRVMKIPVEALLCVCVWGGGSRGRRWQLITEKVS